jgi:hypothetical protein
MLLVKTNERPFPEKFHNLDHRNLRKSKPYKRLIHSKKKNFTTLGDSFPK